MSFHLCIRNLKKTILFRSMLRFIKKEPLLDTIVDILIISLQDDGSDSNTSDDSDTFLK